MEETYTFKGFMPYNLGNYNEAITFYSKSLEINPEDPEVVKFYKVKLTHEHESTSQNYSLFLVPNG